MAPLYEEFGKPYQSTIDAINSIGKHY
jgi:hypothetical protein